MFEIKFEVGDIIYCPYYKKYGEIQSFVEKDLGYILCKDIDTGANFTTSIRHNSVSFLMPKYINLVCKKTEYEHIAKAVILKGID